MQCPLVVEADGVLSVAVDKGLEHLEGFSSPAGRHDGAEDFQPVPQTLQVVVAGDRTSLSDPPNPPSPCPSASSAPLLAPPPTPGDGLRQEWSEVKLLIPRQINSGFPV